MQRVLEITQSSIEDRFLAGADKKLVSARKILAFDEEAGLQQASLGLLPTKAAANSCESIDPTEAHMH